MVNAAKSTPASEKNILTTRNISIVSHVLVWLFFLTVMTLHLLPGLICVCLGFFLTRWLARAFALQKINSAQAWETVPTLARNAAAAVIMVLPLVMLGLALAHSLDYVIATPKQYGDLLHYMARTILELREKLPTQLAEMLPAETDGIQRAIARHLAAKAGTLAMAGRAWLAGLLYAYVGLVIGALAAVRKTPSEPAVLARHLRIRVHLIGESFRHIMAAQLWIASFNTLMTALFLLVLMPLLDVRIPYVPALITLTMMAGLVPILGNLVSNVVVTVVGLSVSPLAGAACLGFLILIHKAEYAINAKVVGHSTHIGVWELLSVMFISEAAFGPAGLVAAPLFYAYLKKELQAVNLV
jgi:predicted PurR-regulated permease PerM